jgi:chloride channel protein, CIC family
MNRGTKFPAETVEEQRGLSILALLSMLAGVASGFLGAVFRLALEQADRLRDALVASAYGATFMGGLLVIAICAVATGIAAWLVRRFSPEAEGSGIPHAEAVARGELPAAPYRLVPVKFFGGLLAIGSGLALGREGPSVQMGASIAHLIGKLYRRNENDCKTLLAAGAGAGLATAFNAPIAGSAFVLEELVRRFDTRITIATLGASAGAIAIARVLLGDTPDFHVEQLPYAGLETVPLHLALGVLAGLLGVAYNRLILAALGATEHLGRLPVELRAALVGAAVGVTAWFAPGWVGGGDAITQRTLAGTEILAVLPMIFLFRFGLGAVSYAAGTPGGLFAPLLVLGAQSGLFFGIFCNHWFPAAAPSSILFAVVGMAAFFTAVVRAPLTGIILVTEMTASFTLLLPMLVACFAAMVVPNLLGNAPIYDSLRERTLEKSRMK